MAFLLLPGPVAAANAVAITSTDPGTLSFPVSGPILEAITRTYTQAIIVAISRALPSTHPCALSNPLSKPEPQAHPTSIAAPEPGADRISHPFSHTTTISCAVGPSLSCSKPGADVVFQIYGT